MQLTSSPLARLRWAFVALAAALLLAAAALLGSALSRLEAQRLLRQRMVAERVFDEVEREISSLLQHEAERPSAAYDTQDTDPERWSTFVVAYYRRDPGLQLVAEPKLSEARKQRARAAVLGMQPWLDARAMAPARAVSHSVPDADREPGASRSSPDVLRALNRSVKVRERRQRDLSETFVIGFADPATLLVERQSPDAERREGFVIDMPALVSTIQGWVLGAQGLDRVAWLYTRAAPRPKTKGFDFAHRLAAPLDSQQVWLRLSRLDDEDAAGTLYGLSALFAMATVLGLLAIYRMVAVQVRFAERRNNFVAAVTHELKTPLTAIRMYGEMLRDGMVQDEATRKEYYGIITAEGERLTRLINNVMEHARLRKGRRLAHLEERDVAEVVREVVELMAPHIEREGFRVELALQTDLPRARIDVDAFKQVLFNVLDNALKYGRAEAPLLLEVGCTASAGRLVVSIRDFGPGVPPEQLGAIFEPFFRGQSELTRRQKGTGIGLALVRDLVELMDGRVEGVSCTPGFEVRITLNASTR